jgi:methylphosphotriester-DNA--protein-cysteine methyltransferase
MASRQPAAMFDIEHTKPSRRCNTAASPMNKADSDRIHELCSLIEKEQDREKFQELVRELNDILNVEKSRTKTDEAEGNTSD